jgi:hypothetical protein
MSACCLAVTAALLVMGDDAAHHRPQSQPVAQNVVFAHQAPSRADGSGAARADGAHARPTTVALPESFFTGRLSGGVGDGPMSGARTRTRIWVIRQTQRGRPRG